MKLSHLRAFHAVAETGSFRRAAAELKVSQPTVSEQVRALEREYDVLLFDRSGRRVVLTDPGTDLHSVTAPLFELASEAEQVLSAARERRVSRLRLAADAPVHAMPLLSALRRRHPGVQVALSTGNSERVLADLLARRADLAVTALPGTDIDERRFAALPLWRNAVVAYVPYRHPLAGSTEARLTQLLHHPLVLREPGSITRRVFEQALSRAGTGLPEWAEVIQVDSREAVHVAVVAGLGVGIVAENELPHDPRIAVLDLVDIAPAVTEQLVCLAEDRRSPLVREVFDLAAEIAEPVAAPARLGPSAAPRT